VRTDHDGAAAVTGSTPGAGGVVAEVEDQPDEVELPEHEQLDIAVRPHRFHHRSLGLVVDEPCAIPGIDLSDYTSPLPRPGWGEHCAMALAPVTLTNGVTFRVNSRIAELVTLIMNANIAEGYGYRQADTGSNNCRKIGGSSQWSMHAWALAIDENWQTNPQASPLRTDRPAWEVRRWMRYGFAWGGNYVSPTRPDAMHNEFMGTPAHADQATTLARQELGHLANMPSPRPSPITGDLEVPGYDAGDSWPNPATMAGAGYTFAMGRLSPDQAKNVDATGLTTCRAAGIALGLFWESTPGRALQGTAAGEADGHAADQLADAIGYLRTAPIFFAVDVGITSSNAPAVQAYAQAFSATTTRPVGAHGDAELIDFIVTPGLPPVQYGYQAATWSGGRISPKAHLYQRVGHPGWPVPDGVAASSFDEEIALKFVPLDGWAGGTPPRNPGVFAWSLSDGHYYGNIAGPDESHGGFHASERDEVANIQRWFVYRDCAPNIPADRWASTTWADGRWGNETDAACTAWHNQFLPNRPDADRIYRDDYVQLVAPPL
jgi:hypothetical protein